MNAISLRDEPGCQELEVALADRIYEFNARATGYRDGRLLGGCVRTDADELIAGFSGHTWGGCCTITHLWVSEKHRGQGLGAALLEGAEAEALRRDCAHVFLATHSFQAPEFYERMGYARVCAVSDWPRGHSNIFYRKVLQRANGA